MLTKKQDSHVKILTIVKITKILNLVTYPEDKIKDEEDIFDAELPAAERGHPGGLNGTFRSRFDVILIVCLC